MKVATKSFRFEDRYGGGTVEEGDRVADDHPLLREFPSCWRDFEVADELRMRSDWVETDAPGGGRAAHGVARAGQPRWP